MGGGGGGGQEDEVGQPSPHVVPCLPQRMEEDVPTSLLQSGWWLCVQNLQMSRVAQQLMQNPDQALLMRVQLYHQLNRIYVSNCAGFVDGVVDCPLDSVTHAGSVVEQHLAAQLACGRRNLAPIRRSSVRPLA